MLRKLSHLTLLLLATSAVLSFHACNDKITECPEVTVCLGNPTEDEIVVYSWNDATSYDTIYPGECAEYTMQDVAFELDRNGEVVNTTADPLYFNTPNREYLIEITECDLVMDAPGGFIDVTADCTNGNFDPQSGEADTDCGGFCDPCVDFGPGCTPQENYMDWDGLLGGSSALSSSEYRDGLFSGTYEATFYMENTDQMEAIFNIEDMPKYSRRFVTGNGDHEVSLEYRKGFGGFGSWYPADGQDVYLLRENGEYRLVFCDVIFRKDGFEIPVDADLALDL